MSTTFIEPVTSARASWCHYVSADGIRWAWTQPTATLLQKLVLLAIATHADAAGMARPSLARLQALTTASERAIRRTIGELRGLKLITVRTEEAQPDLRANVYGLPGWSPAASPHHQDVQPPLPQEAGEGGEETGLRVRPSFVHPDSESGDRTLSPVVRTLSPVVPVLSHDRGPDSESAQKYITKNPCTPESYSHHESIGSLERGYGGKPLNSPERAVAPSAPSPAAPAPLVLVAGGKETPPKFLAAMIDAWNTAVRGSPLPGVQVLTARRERLLRAAWQDFFAKDLTRWASYCRYVAHDPYCRGDLNGLQHQGWVANLDYVTRPEVIERMRNKCQRAIEARRRQGNPGVPPPGEPVMTGDPALDQETAAKLAAVRAATASWEAEDLSRTQPTGKTAGPPSGSLRGRTPRVAGDPLLAPERSAALIH